MTAFPSKVGLVSIAAWPKPLTPAYNRKASPFGRQTTVDNTMALLGAEAYKIGAESWDKVTMHVAVPAGEQFWTRAGRPRAGSPIEHPGVMIELEAKVGLLTFACDRFITWPANLRAIALALEALRKVDRYDVVSGQQYQAFLAIESGIALGPGEFTSPTEAEAFLRGWVGDGWAASDLRAVLREAKRSSHPDLSGDAATFDRVMKAESYLRSHGAIE